jgi:hypothetical protein
VGGLEAIASRLAPKIGETPARVYRIADGHLLLRCDEPSFGSRFDALYRECAVGSASGDGPQVGCGVASQDAPAVCLIEFDDPEPLDPVAFHAAVFADRGYVEMPSRDPGWRLLATAAAPQRPLVAMRGAWMLADRSRPWQPLAANHAVNRLLRLQRELLFLHAGSVALADRGVLILGPKGSGKTTLSLALAARGHGFLGDEVAALRRDRLELVPFRRAVSIRPGPRPRRLREALVSSAPESLPDGTTRARALAGDLFPASIGRRVGLHTALFLRRFVERPSIEAFSPSREHLRLLNPLGCTLWDVPPARRVMDLLALLSRVKCFFLDPGEPDETAELIEKTVSAPWH